MASFIENTDVLTNFKPYVSQAPLIEEMSVVGREKQMQYEQGVQRIQSQIDNIAGLDVIRDVDKNYLQSKLNEMGSNVKKFAAADFSQFQLTTSIGGMISQVGKDKNIQNAVLSTNKYRKEVSNLETARKEGKSSVQNEWDFNTKASGWLNSPDINASFNDTYTPYVDVSKKWMEVIKSLHSDLAERDIAYELNADGTPNYQKTLAAIQSVSSEKVSAPKIENALRASLTPDELNQLSIDGRYTFRDVPPEAVALRSSAKYITQIDKNNATIKDLEGDLVLSSADPEKKKSISNIIDSYKSQNAQLYTDMQEEQQLVLQNPELAKAQLYRNGAIAQFAAAHSWEHNKSTIKKNEVLASEHWEKEYGLNISKFRQEQEEFKWKQFMDQANLGLETEKYKLSIKKTYGESGGFETYLGESTKVKSPHQAMINSIEDTRVQATQLKRGVLAKIPNVTEDQLNQAILNYRSGHPENSNKDIPPQYRGAINQIIELQDQANREQTALSNIEAEVSGRQEFVEMRTRVSKLPPIKVQTETGVVTFSPEEVISYLKDKRIAGTSGPGPALNRLITPRARTLAQADQSQFAPYTEDIINTPGKITNMYNQAVNQSIMDKTGKFVPRISTLEGGDEFVTGMNNMASAVLNRLGGLDISNKGGIDPSEIEKGKKWLTNKDSKDVLYSRLEQGNETFLVMTNADDQVVIPLTDKEVAQLPPDIGSPSPTYRKLVETQALFNGSTNPDGKPENAYYKRYNMPGIKSLNTAVDVHQDFNDPTKQFLEIHLRLPSGWTSIMLENNPMNRENVLGVVNSLTDEQVKKLFVNNPQISERDKELIRNIK